MSQTLPRIADFGDIDDYIYADVEPAVSGR